MRKLLAMLLSASMVACMFTGCGAGSDENQSTTPTATEAPTEDTSKVNLMDLYTIEDPEGVTYDQRVVLYTPELEGSEHYAEGAREIFCVLYGNEGKGVYMYNVEIFDTEENAEAYKAKAEAGSTDGKAYITTSDATFFATMEAFIPDLQTWIDNMSMSGMMELE